MPTGFRCFRIMVGVIIAAGMGLRLSGISGGNPKTLLPVNGKPVIQWIIDGATESGIESFFIVIVTGYRSERIENYFVENPNKKVTLLYNKQWEKGNGISVLCSEKVIDENEEFLLMMSDHLIGKEVVRSLVKKRESCPLLAVGQDLKKVFDIDDATRVYIDDERIVSIGKGIEKFNGVDAGVFVLNNSIFWFLKKSIEQGKDSLTDGIKEMIKEQCLHAYPIPENVKWIDIDSELSYKNAIRIWRKYES